MAAEGIKKHVAKDGKVTWRVRVELPPDPVTGQRRGSMKTFRTKAEAEAARATWIADLERGIAVNPSRLTVREYLESWLTDTAAARNRPSTLECYRSVIRSRIIPALGGIGLQKLTATHLQRFYREQSQSPKQGRHHGTLSLRMVRFMHSILHKGLKDAERLGLVAVNPASKASPPAAPRPTLVSWDEGEIAAFLAVAAECRTYGPVYRVAIATGLRMGELLGLTWPGVDLERGVLTIRHTMTQPRAGSPSRLAEPKTPKSRRSVTLDAETLATLKAWRLAQIERRLAAGGWENPDLVFSNEGGAFIRPDNLARHFDALQARAGVPRIRFHDLRHAAATLALLAGVPLKVISERLGHTTIAITADMYAYVTPSMQQDAAERIGRALAGG